MTIPLDDPATGHEKRPGEWRRKGENGPPVVTDINGGQAKYVTYSRPSNFGKQVENTFNLERYQQRNGVIGMYLEPTLVDEMAALWAQPDHDDQAWKLAVDGVYTKAAKAAGAMLKADRGTHGHLLTENHDLGHSIVSRIVAGEELGLPRAVQVAVWEVWEALIDAYFEVLVVEAPCIYDRWRVAGTLDRIVRTRVDLTFGDVTIPAGTVIVLDIKTGGLNIGRDGRPNYWSAYAVQCAAYANSVPYDVDTEQRGEWPWPVSTEHAVIAHIDIGGALDTDVMCAQLFYVDLAAGHAAGELVVACKEWQKRRDVFSPEGLYCSTITINTEGTCQPAPAAARADVVAALGYEHDEGRTLEPDSFVPLEALHASLPTEAQNWFHGIVAEADRASVPFRGRHTKTLRRYELYRGLLLLAQGGGDADEIVRALVALALDTDAPLYPCITTGHAVGAMGATEAEKFAGLCVDYVDGGLTASFHDDGLMRLVRAA